MEVVPSETKPEVDSSVDKKQFKKSIGNRKGRLIIRNLAFRCKEKDLKTEFEKFGTVEEVSIARKPDGKLRGFAFIQFEETSAAAKAIEEKNAKSILGRPVAIDWAIPKKMYDSMNAAKKPIKSEEATPNIKSEPMEEVPSNTTADSDDEEESSDEDGEDSANESDANEENGISSDEEEEKSSQKKPRGKKISNDADEGKTVFVRNLPFDMEEEELTEKFSNYGDVKYCKIVMDRMTDHSKGTAFIQFKEKEHAEICLNKCSEDHEDGGLILEGRRIYANLALTRQKVKDIAVEKEQSKESEKDKRNLYLAREGLIREGTDAAEGISPADLAKRANLETRKRRLLKDLKMFISKTRLGVYNVPLNMNDKQLRKLFLNAAGDIKASLTESRVMRDMDQATGQKLGKSKGHGYVEFVEHEHALKALRSLNNNPNTFTAAKRPIVEFSVENIQVYQTRERRLQKSIEKNKEQFKGGRPQKKNLPFKEKSHISEDVSFESKKFMGTTGSKDKIFKGMKSMPSHSGPKIRHKKRDPPKTALTKASKSPKVKRKLPDDANNTDNKRRKNVKGAAEDKSFTNLLDQYRAKLKSNIGENFEKSKWFDDN